jgi:hypothetical protein
MGREMPINDMVKSTLEEEKQKKFLDEIVANNPVEVPEDFEIPKPSEEDDKADAATNDAAACKCRCGMPEGMEEEPAAEKPAPKPAPKKK